MNTVPTKHRNPVILLCVLVIAVALMVRIWHDRHAGGMATFSDIEQEARSHPDDLCAQLNWGVALDGQHRFDEAEAAFITAAKLAPSDSRPLDSLARLAMERYRPGEALTYLDASLQLNPNSSDNWSSLGTLLSQKNPSAALKAFAHAVKLDPRDAFSLLKLGVLEMDRNQIDRGMHDLQRAASINPDDLETEIALGNAARFNNRPTVAKDAFQKALMLRPDDPKALLGSASITLQLDPSTVGITRAARQLEKVMAGKPTADAYLIRGHWNLLTHHYQQAVSDLKMALALKPALEDCHSFLSQAYAALGERELAQRESAAFMASSKAASTNSTSNPVRATGQ